MEEGEEALPDEGGQLAESADQDEITVNFSPEYLQELVGNLGVSHLFTQSRAEHDYDHVTVSQRGQRRKGKAVPPQYEMHGLEPESPAQLAESNMPSTSDFTRMDSGTVRVQQPIVRMTPHRASFGAGDPPLRRIIPPQLSSVSTPRLHQSPQRIPLPHRIREPSFSESATPVHVTYRAADPPPHRAMDNSRPMNIGPAAAPRLKAMSPAEFSHLSPGPHGSAPMLVPGRGSRPVVRGKSGSQTIRGKKDDLFQDEEALPTASSITSPAYMSPRKVHFSESQPNESPSYAMHPEPSIAPPVLHRSPERRLGSPVKSPQRLVPGLPPNIVERPPPVPVPLAPPKTHIPVVAEDPHPLPENIIDDAPEAPPPPPPPAPVPRPPREESHLPPNIAELAIQFMPKNDVPLVGAEREENVKERIAQIAQHLTSGFQPMSQQQQAPVVAPPMISSPPHKVMKSRNVRTIGPTGVSSGSAPVPPFLMPDPKSRLPGTSPVRTNLDFNSHLSYKSPNRSLSMAGSALARVNADSPGKKRGRPKKKSYVLDDDDSDEEEPQEAEKDVEDETWVTRCICGYEDNWEDMVECEGCQAWQHYVCLGLPQDANTDGFKCEVCEPGKLLQISPDDAREEMRRLLKKPKDRHSSVLDKKKASKKSPPAPVPKSASKSAPKKTEASVKNVYTKTAKKLLQVCGADKSAFRGKVLDGCLKKLIVAPDAQGLVANWDIPEGTAVVEIIGNVCLPNEANATAESFHHEFIFVYDGLGDTGSTDDTICIDARKHSTDGRFIRRCCQPNASIQHTTTGGQTNFVVVTREKVANGAEITLPFDYGRKPVISACSCHGTGDNCLLKDNFIGPGHRLPVAVKKETTPIVKKNNRGKKEEPRATTTTVPEIAPKLGAKDEKSEEEIVADNNNKTRIEPNRKRSKTTLATPRRGSDKEEVSKDIVDTKRARGSAALSKTVSELQKMADAVKFTPSSERNKPSREERKLQSMMERFAPKSRAKESEDKKEPKKESGHKRRPSKTEVEPSTSTNETAKRKKTNEEVKEESEEPSSSSMPPPSKKSRDESEQGTVPMKKSILARYEAESKETGAAKKSRSNERDAGEEEAANALAEMHNGTPLNIRDEMRKGLDKAMDQIGKPEYYCLPPDLQEEAKRRPVLALPSTRHASRRQPEKPFVSPMEKKPSSPGKTERNSRSKEVKPEVKEVKAETVRKEEKVEPATKEMVVSVKKEEKTEPVKKEEKTEPVKKDEPPPEPKRKAISIEEYKKRQQESGPSKEQPRETRKGFIPTMDEEDIAVTTSLPPIPLPALETKPVPPPPEIRSMATRSSPNVRPSRSPNVRHSTSFVSPAPPPPPVRTRASTSTSDETPKPRLSIADRLSVEFGVGTPSRRSNF